jgi:hypothetical protein
VYLPDRVLAKAFILGEYLALSEGPALIWCFSPGFFLSENSSDGISLTEIHVNSPSSGLREWNKLFFYDPFRGRGGFGASTAQFILLSALSKNKTNVSVDWREIRTEYQKKTMKPGVVLPSGYDLIAQTVTQGKSDGAYLVSIDEGAQTFSLSRGLERSLGRILVFSATQNLNRKLPTHEHLSSLSEQKLLNHPLLMRDLKSCLTDAADGIQRGSGSTFGFCLTKYADLLHEVGLESEPAFNDRLVFQKLSGVMGTKGTGALLNDGVLVFVKPTQSIAQILSVAQERGLVLISDSFEGALK